MKRALFAALLFCSLAHAQSGKVIELYVGYSVGGGYDVYARLLARHMGKHLPGNPVIVPKNMEGAGSLRLANWLFKAARATGRCSAPSAAASPSIRCSAPKARSSRPPSSAGSAARTTR